MDNIRLRHGKFPSLFKWREIEPEGHERDDDLRWDRMNLWMWDVGCENCALIVFAYGWILNNVLTVVCELVVQIVQIVQIGRIVSGRRDAMFVQPYSTFSPSQLHIFAYLKVKYAESPRTPYKYYNMKAL